MTRCARPSSPCPEAPQADLYGLARQRLAAVGVTRVTGGGRCTWGDPERFYSYRRDRATGRMLSFVGIVKTP